MSSVVVDTSIVLKWVLVEPDSALANALLASWNSQGATVLAPVLLAYEVSNALRQRQRQGVVTPAETHLLSSRLLAGSIRLDMVDQMAQLGLSDRALDFALQFNLPAAYDAHYLALAEREGCEYWTAEERLWNAVKAQLPWVRWLGSFGAVSPVQTTP